MESGGKTPKKYDYKIAYSFASQTLANKRVQIVFLYARIDQSHSTSITNNRPSFPLPLFECGLVLKNLTQNNPGSPQIKKELG